MSQDTEPQHSEASPQPTPGPWEWKMPPWGGLSRRRRIWKHFPTTLTTAQAIDSESLDANLIAAPPDLLAALDAAYRFEGRFIATWAPEFQPDWFKAAKIALAKARGRNQ